jgi:hypothetical protein
VDSIMYAPSFMTEMGLDNIAKIRTGQEANAWSLNLLCIYAVIYPRQPANLSPTSHLSLPFRIKNQVVDRANGK